MTMMQAGDWGDDRLDAAFAARAAGTPSTPPDIDEVVRRRVASDSRVPVRWPWLAAAAAFVALVVVAGGSSLLVLPEPSPTLPEAAASGPPPAASGQPPALTLAPRPTIDVLAALGEPLTVSEALEVRTSEIRQQEILVEGFLSPPPSIHCAMAVLHRHPLMPPDCAMVWHWLMEAPEELAMTGSGVVSMRRPSGPAFIPSFALVESPGGPLLRDMEEPVPVIVLGHFNDRRASSCGDKREQCLETFLVDRVVELNGVAHPVQTRNGGAHTPEDRESDVDALVSTAAPSVAIVSRQLVTAAQALDLEPVLKQDQIIPYIDQSKLAWLLTTVDLSDVDVPYARTFMLLDGSSWFAEITRSGAVMHERSMPGPTRGPALGPTAEPDAFASAPFSVAGIRVEGVSEITRELRAEDSTILREEHAVRGWYIAPRPGVACDPALPPVHAPTPPCDEARHWLLTDPQLYGVEEGQLRRDPVAAATILNPLLPVDVPFDVGATWRGDVPVPQPVVVLGHFSDSRVNGYRSNEYLVIDALVWSRTDRALDRVTRMTETATEDPSTVAARIGAVSPEAALATWITVMNASDFAIVESHNAASEASEFTSGPPVWIVQRLVYREDEQVPEFAIETSYTADQGTRVWWRPTLDWYLDLATTIDILDLDEHTDVLKVFDYSDVVVSIGSAEGRSGLAWRKAGPVTGDYEVAPGRTDREVVVRWRGPECDGSQRLNIADLGNGGIRLEPRDEGPGCTSGDVWRRVVIEFDHPVDVDRFRTGDPCCG